MATFMAAAPLEPGHFEHFLTIVVEGSTTVSFTAINTGTDSEYTFTGSNLTYDLSGVLSGTVTGISEVDASSNLLYTLSGLSLNVATLDFPGGFVYASDIVVAALAGNDSFTGTEGNDTLEALAGADTLDARGGDDLLVGGDGNDSLLGGAGNDLFDGGAGADRMIGGAGDDYFLVRQTTDVVSEAADGGHDTVVSYVTRTLGSNQEDLALSGAAALDGTGNRLANLLLGNGAANELSGLESGDMLIGSGGADLLDGGTGDDVLWGQSPYAVEAMVLTETARNYLNVQGKAMASGLGGAAGFGENALAAGDDLSSEAIDLTAVFGPGGVNFYGTTYASMYINNNGNVTFGAPLAQFEPDQITGGSLPIIAPFWADVDTRPASVATTDRVYWDVDTVNGTLTVTWNAVGYYEQHGTPRNSFQLQLVNEGGGDFDIIFRYPSINWTTGDASGGTDGLGGTAARAGYSAGNGVSFFELGQSGQQAAMLELDNTPGNTGRNGTYVFNVRNGDVLTVDDRAEDTLAGGTGRDTLAGGGGADSFVLAHAGSANKDVIQDFTPGKDRIVLDSSFFTGLAAGVPLGDAFRKAAAAQDGDDRIVYNKTSGNLYYDADGAGGNSAVLIATLTKSPDALAASDFIVT